MSDEGINDGDTNGVQDVPAYHVVVGNPARILRKIERKFKAEQDAKLLESSEKGESGLSG